MQKFYNWLTLSGETKIVQNLNYYRAISRELENTIAYLKPSQKLHFLDFGLGWSEWSLMAQGYGHHVYGIELSEEKKKFAKKHGIEVINWNDIINYKFDFINTEQVLEHISKPLDTLQYLKESLKENGIIKISIPNGENVEQFLKNPNWLKQRLTGLMPIAPLEHINCFRKKSIVTMANICNLKLVTIPPSATSFEKQILNILRPLYRLLRKKSIISCYYLSKSNFSTKL